MMASSGGKTQITTTTDQQRRNAAAAAAAAVIVLDSSEDDDNDDKNNENKRSIRAAATATTTKNKRATSLQAFLSRPTATPAATAPKKSGGDVSMPITNATRNKTTTTPTPIGGAGARNSCDNKDSQPRTNTPAVYRATPPAPRRIQPTLLSRTVSRKRSATDDGESFNSRSATMPIFEHDDDDISIINEPILMSPKKKHARCPSTSSSSSISITNNCNRNSSGSTSNNNHIVSASIQHQTTAPSKTAQQVTSTNATTPTAPATSSPPPPSPAKPAKTPITAAFGVLLDACREADPSAEMEQLITRKLTRYYHTVHPDFVCSKSFSRAALRVATDIRAHPKLVYMKLAGILEELNIRRRSGQTATTPETTTDVETELGTTETAAAASEPTKIKNEMKEPTPVKTSSATTTPAASPSGVASPNTTIQSPTDEPAATSTGNAKKDQQIKRLNHALYVLKKHITRLDAADVDLADEENSPYLQAERCKKRACEIYEKICDITGESKHACRATRKPIVFEGTAYPLFNRTIQSFVNKTRQFPNLFDVRRCLEHCNAQYGYDLSRDDVSRVAQAAFAQIGELLQRRRKMDLYESMGIVAAIGCSETDALVDPALNDVQLQRKLAENQAEYKRRMNAVIDRFAAEQERPELAEKKSTPKSPQLAAEVDQDESPDVSFESFNDEQTKKLEKNTPAIKVECTEMDHTSNETTAAAASEPNDGDDDAMASSSDCIVVDDEEKSAEEEPKSREAKESGSAAKNTDTSNSNTACIILDDD